MTRREGWGAALVGAAGFTFWWATVIWAASASDAAGRQVVFFYRGVSGSEITGWIQLVSLLGGAVGSFLLASSLIGRIRQRWLRRSLGWSACAASILAAPYLAVVVLVAYLGAAGIGDDVELTAPTGQSVLVTQDGFDGDVVTVYTRYDEFHYVMHRSADELAGFPRVKDRDCHLVALDGSLRLTCGEDSVTINAQLDASHISVAPE
ncbi:hypothetical protein AB4Y67_08280 [Arthrobacter sp. YAF17]|uniref:hypothetical protein n=1 Tax=Arthrobacter sp. YAF17 TaxID=3233077 RepID=UPI003F9365E8